MKEPCKHCGEVHDICQRWCNPSPTAKYCHCGRVSSVIEHGVYKCNLCAIHKTPGVESVSEYVTVVWKCDKCNRVVGKCEHPRSSFKVNDIPSGLTGMNNADI
jgi:hypothetical protein